MTVNGWIIVLWMVAVLVAFTAGAVVGHHDGKKVGRSEGILAGYKKAYDDYRQKMLECRVKVNHPEWLIEQEEKSQ